MSKKKDLNNNIEILIVEDSLTQIEQLRYFLEQHDYSVSTASNGKEGLEVAKRHHPAIIISDIVMPEMDGFELCIEIRKIPELRTLPIVVVSTHVDGNYIIKGLRTGADDYISKPIEPDLVERVIARITTTVIPPA